MYNIDAALWEDSDAIKPMSAGAVEVTRIEDGVLLRAGSGAPAVKISEWGWADFAAAVDAGEFDATLQYGGTFRTSDIAPEPTDVVEVTRADDGVLLRAVPGATAVHIPRRAWAGFLAGIYDGVFSDTLPRADDVFALLDAE